MKKYVVGIDLGTSSVKLFVSGGDTAPVRAEYADADFESGVRAALKQLYRSVSPEEIASVGFSGQTGTYLVVRDGQVCHSVYWHEPGRESALARTMEMFGEADWIRMTGMRHPHLASYPVPTILHFRESGIPDGLIMQPKDYVIRLLTGEFVSDCGSWRGLVHPKTGRYEPELLRALDVDASALPRMEKMARVSAEGTARFGLPEGTPVYVGHNDFYSALYGIGADNTGDAFDVTGTSEHFGVVTDGLGEKGLTESPYLNGKYVRYGVTGSGGPSLLWGAKNFGPMPEEPVRDAPVFLPYLRGERQIDADPCARGVFMGISERTDSRALSYSVAEGAAFSIFRMYERLGRPEFRRRKAGAL